MRHITGNGGYQRLNESEEAKLDNGGKERNVANVQFALSKRKMTRSIQYNSDQLNLPYKEGTTPSALSRVYFAHAESSLRMYSYLHTDNNTDRICRYSYN